MNKKKSVFVGIICISMFLLLFATLLTACSNANKRCTVTVVGVCGSNRLYTQTLKYKESDNKTLTPMEIDGYTFDNFVGATGEQTIDLTYDLNKREIKVKYRPDFLNLPVFWINTLGGADITDKENYLKCDVSVMNTEDNYTLNNVAAGIRGRGNSTWRYEKKPYRIKFDKKQSLFGWDKNKSWVLLALYQDFSDIKDYTAFNFADAISDGESFVPHAKHVEVYINGEYRGLYLLTDQVQENKGRTDVEEDFTADATEVPFLVEWDEYAPTEGKKGVDYFSIKNGDTGITSHYNVKYPEPEQRFNQAQFDYIKNYVANVNSMCHSAETTEDEFARYVDVDAFIDYYLIQEIMGNYDINYKSIYMSKAIGSKLVMGPVWDFDYSAGGPMDLGGNDIPSGLMSDSNWFYFMLKKDWFKRKCLDRLKAISATLNERLMGIAQYKQELAPAAKRNASKWDFDKNDSLMDFDESYDFVLNFVRTRIANLPEYISAV